MKNKLHLIGSIITTTILFILSLMMIAFGVFFAPILDEKKIYSMAFIINWFLITSLFISNFIVNIKTITAYYDINHYNKKKNTILISIILNLLTSTLLMLSVFFAEKLYIIISYSIAFVILLIATVLIWINFYENSKKYNQKNNKAKSCQANEIFDAIQNENNIDINEFANTVNYNNMSENKNDQLIKNLLQFDMLKSKNIISDEEFELIKKDIINKLLK